MRSLVGKKRIESTPALGHRQPFSPPALFASIIILSLQLRNDGPKGSVAKQTVSLTLSLKYCPGETVGPCWIRNRDNYDALETFTSSMRPDGINDHLLNFC